MKREHTKPKHPSALVASRMVMPHLWLPIPYIVISMSDPGQPDVEFAADPFRKDVLRLSFYDLVSPKEGFASYTIEEATRVWEFVDKWIADIDAIVCQCEAGISRSAGLAAAISRVFNDEDSYYFKTFLPNMLLYRTTLRVREGMSKAGSLFKEEPREPGK